MLESIYTILFDFEWNLHQQFTLFAPIDVNRIPSGFILDLWHEPLYPIEYSCEIYRWAVLVSILDLQKVWDGGGGVGKVWEWFNSALICSHSLSK